MARSPSGDTESWFATHGAEQRAQAQTLAALVRAAADPQEAVKWGRLTFTVGGDWHHWVCAVAVTKSAVTLVFHKGVLLADPAGLLRGTGRYVRQVDHATASGRTDAVTALVREAVLRQKDMLGDDA